MSRHSSYAYLPWMISGSVTLSFLKRRDLPALQPMYRAEADVNRELCTCTCFLSPFIRLVIFRFFFMFRNLPYAALHCRFFMGTLGLPVLTPFDRSRPHSTFNVQCSTPIIGRTTRIHPPPTSHLQAHSLPTFDLRSSMLYSSRGHTGRRTKEKVKAFEGEYFLTRGDIHYFSGPFSLLLSSFLTACLPLLHRGGRARRGISVLPQKRNRPMADILKMYLGGASKCGQRRSLWIWMS